MLMFSICTRPMCFLSTSDTYKRVKMGTWKTTHVHLYVCVYLNFDGLLEDSDWFRCAEADLQRKCCLWLHNPLLLVEGELVSQLLQSTQFPGHRDQGRVGEG